MRRQREDLPSTEPDATHEAPIRSQIDLDAALGQRRPLPARLLVVALMAGLFAAVVVPVWHALASQPILGGAAAGHTTALVLSNVSTGTLTLNGRRMAFADALVISLAPGANTLEFDAPPFLSRQCVLTWPDGSDRDTCHGPDQDSPFYPHPATIQVGERILRPDYIIAFPLALQDLPAQQRQLALGSVTEVLASDAAARQTTVRPGEHYAVGMDAQGMTTPGIATMPLTATPTLDLDTSGAINGCGDGICATAGSADDLARPESGGVLRWAVQVPVWMGWRFQSSDGAVVASVRFPQSLDLILEFAGPRGWRIAPPSGAASASGNATTQILYESCIAGEAMVNTVAPQFTSSQQAYVTGQGCLITASGLPPSRYAEPLSGTFVWRFGVLLAADEATHSQVPDIPLALPAEVAAVVR